MQAPSHQHDAIAEAAGVTRPNVFAGRDKSARVVAIVRRLIERGERRGLGFVITRSLDLADSLDECPNDSASASRRCKSSAPGARRAGHREDE